MSKTFINEPGEVAGRNIFLARLLGSNGFERDVAIKTVPPVLSTHSSRSTAFLRGFVDEALSAKTRLAQGTWE